MQKDIQSIGTIMIKIIKPATFLSNPESIILKYLERWNDSLEIKRFLSAIATSEVIKLQGVRAPRLLETLSLTLICCSTNI